MEKEFVLTLGRARVGKIFIDENNLFHCFSAENRLEFISPEQVDINQVMEVLLEESHNPKFIRIPVKYLNIPDHDKQRNLAISIYSESGQLTPRIYIHDVDEKVLISYINVDGIMVRNLRKSEESLSEEPETISEYTIAERLLYFRKRSGRSVTKLSRKAGISRVTWVSVESGRIENPSIYTLSAMCDALGITLADFFATDIFGVRYFDISLVEELKYLSPVEQRLLTRKLRNKRLNHSE